MSDKAVERETTKLFVGNVPFKCTLDEFREVFQDLDGFKNAELIQRGKSNLTRGFGVVEFNSADYLDDHCDREYELKGRTLRVTRYQPQEKEQRSYKIFLRGVAGLTEQDLENAFGVYGTVNSVELLTKPQSDELSGSAVIEFSEKESLLKALENRTPSVSSTLINVYPFRRTPKNDFNKSPTSSVYQKGIHDGKIVGYNNGFKRGYAKGISDAKAN